MKYLDSVFDRMPSGKAPAPPSSSSSDSEFEEVVVEPEPEGKAETDGAPAGRIPGTTAKAKPAIPAKPATPSSSTEEEEPAVPGSPALPEPARPDRRERRPISPERPPSTVSTGGKGKSKGKGKITCPHCWARISRTSESSMDQHQFWNTVCLAWQVYSQGNVSWARAQEDAERIKRFREMTHPDDMENAIASGPAGSAGSKGSPLPVAVPLPADVRTEGRTRRRKEDKPKRHVEDTPKHDKAKEKEKKGRKKKAERNKKTGKRVSPSPEVARPKGPHKRPPSDDSSEGHRDKQPKIIAQEGRHLVIRLPRSR